LRQVLDARQAAFVVGALGLTPKAASISPDVNDAGARNIRFEEMRKAYDEAIEALLKGDSDVLTVETIFDTLNAKAALFAIDAYFVDSGERLPLIISGTVTDASGRILSGQTVAAFWHSVRHAEAMARSVALVGEGQLQRGVFYYRSGLRAG
jgi:5-methyltetrahydrofolate--homocysteine methyltransferase